LALATRPHGPSRMNPPAKSMPASGCPCASCGVWQSAHPAMVTKYFPRFSGVETSGSGTGVSNGMGALRIREFTEKINCDHEEERLARNDAISGLRTLKVEQLKFPDWNSK
jgi:hypothetical protein